jgi:NADPH:quinone reductase
MSEPTSSEAGSITTGAIRVHQVGGPEVLRWEQVPVGVPGKGQARVRHHFAGLNFTDVYHRTGLYKQPLPLTPGMEGSGEVVALGPEGTGDLKVGDRVAYAGGAPGAYSQERLIAADRLVRLPAEIDHRTAAAMMLKGMTAQYLLRQTIVVEPGDTILMHAAAGGVGLILCQWAKHLGATVIGTAGGPEKVELARAHGCDHVIDYKRERFVDRVKEITGGKGVRVVYDGVGKDTFMDSLDCLKVRGLLVLFGQSSGVVPPFDPSLLAAKGCLYLTRPVLWAYTASREELARTAEDLFRVVASGAVKIRIAGSFPLAEAAEAHRTLEARLTTGSTVLEI